MLKNTLICLSLLAGLYYRAYIMRIMQACIATVCYLLLSMSSYLANPIVKTVNNYQTIQHIHKVNQALKLTNRQLHKELIQARSLLYETRITQPLAEFAERYHCELIGAHVIGRTLSDHLQIFMLNKGSKHGVSKDMIGIWYNYCIGKVYEVHPYSSVLILISDARCMVPGVSIDSKAYGMVRGLNKSTCCGFDYVEHTNNLQKGMHIITSGEGTIFPQGFGIGQLSGVTKRSLYYEAYIELAYKPQDIEYCYLGSKARIENNFLQK